MIIVGAGPVGLAAAIDLAQRGVAGVVLDDNDVVSARLARDLLVEAHARDLRPARRRRAHGREGRDLEASARSSCGDARSIAFDLLPENGHKHARPSSTCSSTTSRISGRARARAAGLIDLRWKNKVVGRGPDRATACALTVETPDGRYASTPTG